MKTISSRFLKGAVAVLLAVLMIFGSTLTGFAAVVDNAETGGNHSGGYIYFVKPSTWTNAAFIVGHGSWFQTYKMTQLSGNLYYLNLRTAAGGNWDGWSGWGFVDSNTTANGSTNVSTKYKTYSNYTGLHTSYALNNNSTYTIVGSSTNNDAISPTYQSSGYSALNKATQNVYCYSTTAGGTSYSPDAEAASTLKVTTRQLSGNGSLGTATASSKSASATSVSRTAAWGTSVTVDATATTGYVFKGWYSSSTSTTALSTSTSYTYNATNGNTSVYAKFEKAGYAYTVTAGTGGTVSPTSGNATSVDITATPNDGYNFAGWEVTGGSVADTSDPTTTFTITAANANAHATFTPADYSVTLNTDGGTINSGNVTGYTFGNTVTLPTDVTKTGYTFKGWKDSSGNTVTQIKSTDYGNKTYTAQWQINTYTITVNQNAGGTTKVGSTTISATTGTATFDYGTSVTVVVTPSTNYKISGISGAITSGESETAVTKTFTVTDNATISVNFALAGSCSVHFNSNATKELVIGETYENTASTDSTYCKGNGSVNYSSSDTSVATVDASGVVTAVKPGTAVITATCTTDTSAKATYEVHVLAPTLTFDEITLDVNGTADADEFRNVANAPKSSYTVTYTAIASGDVRVTSAGVITAMGPTTGVNVTANITCGSWSDTVTFPVSVNTPTLNFNPKAVNLIVGQTMTDTFTASASVGNPTITIASDNTSVLTLSNNKGTAKAAGSTTVTATFAFNDYYKPVATSTVLVAAASIKANPTSVALEFGEGATATSTTVTLETNAPAGNGTGDDVTVTSAKTSVATATLSGSTITITAAGVGTTTVTAKFHDATVSIPVTVTQYDPYVYLYVTDNNSWGSMYLYSWKGTNTVVTPITTSMIYIGKNGDNQNIYAYRFLKTNLPEKIILAKNSSWGSQTADTPINWNDTDHRAFYFTSNSNKSTMTDWTIDCMIVRPTVSVADVVVPVGGTATATATVTDGGNVLWKSQGTSIATIADVTTKTSTVTGVTPGETTITARAFVDTANSSIKTLPTNYKTDTACWPFISTEATANVTVGSVDYNVSVDSSTGGTASITVGGEDKGTSATIAHGTEYTLTATASEGYRFVGFYNGETEISTTSPYTTTAKADAAYMAKFVKTYKVSVLLDSGIELVKLNSVNSAEGFTDIEVDAGATITVYATPKETYKFIGWTDADGNTVSTMVNYTLTVNGDLTLKATSVPSYTAVAEAQTNKYFGEYGGTVKINGQTSPQQFLAGETVTFTSEPKTNYYFAGWYSDVDFTNLVSADATYETTMTEDGITLFGLFVKRFYITNKGTNIVELVYNIADNSYSATGDFTDHLTVTSADGNNVTEADVQVVNGKHTGCTVAGHYTSYQVTPDTENYNTEAPVTYTLTPDVKADGSADGTYTLNIKLSDAEKVAISLNGQKIADKAIGSTFTYTVTAPAGQYVSSVTTEPAVDVTINGNEISFKVPETNVNIIPAFANYSYVKFTDTTGLTITGLKNGYKAGERVEITVAPASAQVSIADITADNDSVVVTDNGTDWTVTIASMPADTTINLTTTVDAKFKMDYGMTAIGNYGSGYTTYGTVAMKIGETSLSKGGYADKTETVTYTATPNTNFIFDGWYSDSACSVNNLLSRNTSYDVTPTKDTTIYALFVPKHYLAENQAQVATNFEMTYDPETRSFKYTSSTISKSAWFRVSNNKTTSAWTDSNSYCVFGSGFNVTFNANSYNVTVGWGKKCYALNSSADAEYPYDIIVAINGNSSIDVSCRAKKTGSALYLSSGRLDLPGSYNAAVFEATSEFTHEGAVNPTDIYVADEDENREKYKKVNLEIAEGESKTVSFKTTITGTAAPNYRVESYVIYHVNTKTYSVETANDIGGNQFEATAVVDGDCYIVPIYFLRPEYAEANNLVEIDIYFDATAILDQAWGPFVACYAWGSNNTEYHGGWSGQMMIPTNDGKSFYTQLAVPKSDDPNAPSVPNGVTFNNYMQSTVVGSNPGAFGVSATQYQCYDYREPITLYEAGYDVITFVAKDSTDGYHGDRANGVTVNTITSSTTDIFNKYHFDYLYNRDGDKPMNFNGDVIENYVDLEVAKADYYVITKGDITYDPKGTKYVGDSNFDADWAVDWYIFDSNGKFITNILSTAMWHDKDNDLDNGLQSYLHDALKLTAEDVAGKTVAISYEHENNADHQVSYDGQWYGNMLDHTVNASVVVGLQVGQNQFEVNENDPLNEAIYGKGHIVDADGNYHQTYDIEMDYGIVDLTASSNTYTDPVTGVTTAYRFVGWYTKLPNGTYKQVGNSPSLSTYINMKETYYAMFKPIGEKEIVINHLIYNNPNDQYIPSHGGVGELSVKVTDSKGNLVYNSAPNTTASVATFEATDLETYTIEIITTPLLKGQFFAWYTDSENSDGSATYEEVFTDPDAVGKTTTVSATFEYTYDSVQNPQTVINIYSDIRRVSNEAKLIYQYKNRYGNWRTYTVSGVKLTDDECFGYEGNNKTPYCPTFRTLITYVDANGNEYTDYYAADKIDEAIAEIKSMDCEVVRQYNMIAAYAPKAEVTEVYNGVVSWIVDGVKLTTDVSEVRLTATDGTPRYTINYTMAGINGSQSGEYNTLLDILAPEKDQYGKAFSYWMNSATGKILTYTRHYNYRLLEDMTIEAVYGVEVEDEWTPTIESVTYTREFGDNGDIIYTDYHLAYTSRDGKVLNDVKGDENIKYGLLLLRDSAYYYDGVNAPKYPDYSNATIKEKLQTVASYGSSKAFTVDSIKYNCYCYDLSALELTNFNRCDYFRQYSNTAIVGGSHYYREYAFTAVPYMNIDGDIILGGPEYVNFYDLGMEEPTNNAN